LIPVNSGLAEKKVMAEDNQDWNLFFSDMAEDNQDWNLFFSDM